MIFPIYINLIYHGGFTSLYTTGEISSQSIHRLSRNFVRAGDQRIFKAPILWWSFNDDDDDDNDD